MKIQISGSQLRVDCVVAISWTRLDTIVSCFSKLVRIDEKERRMQALDKRRSMAISADVVTLGIFHHPGVHYCIECMVYPYFEFSEP